MTMPANNTQMIADFIAYLRIERGAKENTLASYERDVTVFSPNGSGRHLLRPCAPICSAISPTPCRQASAVALWPDACPACDTFSDS